MSADTPTARQLEVLRLIAEGIHAGLPPSIAELGVALGIRSTNAVDDHLQALTRKGLLEPRHPRRARDLALTKAGWLWVGERSAA